MIRTGTESSFAKLHPDCSFNFPEETSLQKKGNCLFYAGGNNFSFNCEKFEMYGLQI